MPFTRNLLAKALLADESEGRRSVRQAVQNHALPMQERVDLFQRGVDTSLEESQGSDDRLRALLGASAGVGAGVGGSRVLGRTADSTYRGLGNLQKDRARDVFNDLLGRFQRDASDELAESANSNLNIILGSLEQANPRGVDPSVLAERMGGDLPAAARNSFEELLSYPTTRPAFEGSKKVEDVLGVFREVDGSDRFGDAVPSRNLVRELAPDSAISRARDALRGKGGVIRKAGTNPAVLGALAVLGGVAGKMKADKDQQMFEELAGDDNAVAKYLRKSDMGRLTSGPKADIGMMANLPRAAQGASRAMNALLRGARSAPTEHHPVAELFRGTGN